MEQFFLYKKGILFMNCPKKLDTIWGHFYGEKSQIQL